MITFPSMIDWMDDIGMEELHRMHRESSTSPISFSRFVKELYNNVKEDWDEMMHVGGKVNFGADVDGDMSLEMAKEALVSIVNKGIEEFNVGAVVIIDELAPDHESGQKVVDDFWGTLIPAFEKFLKDLRD